MIGGTVCDPDSLGNRILYLVICDIAAYVIELVSKLG